MFSEFKYALLVVTFGLMVAVPLQHMLRKIDIGEVTRRSKSASPEQAAGTFATIFFGPTIPLVLHWHRVPLVAAAMLAIGTLGAAYAILRHPRQRA